MCLTEYNEAEVMSMFKEEGKAEGKAKGREEASNLINFLWEHGRSEDAKQAGRDPQFMNQLLIRFKGVSFAEGAEPSAIYTEKNIEADYEGTVQR